MKKILGSLSKQLRRRGISGRSKDITGSNTPMPLSNDSMAQSLEALEPRIMLDAAGVATTADVLLPSKPMRRC